MTTVTDATEPGLRERKRRATRRAIQVAVLELVAERGLDGVTVDEVSRIADISPRTFFNYFASKEEAILGDPPELPVGEATERFVANSDGMSLLDGLEALLVLAGDRTMEDPEMVQLRMRVVKEHPQLFAMRIAKMRAFEEQITHEVSRRILTDEPGADPADADNRARLITLVAFGAMRHAWARWATSDPPTELSVQLAGSFDQLKALFAPVGQV